MAENVDIHFAHADENVRPIVATMLESLSHRLSLVTDSGEELILASRAKPPGLLISSLYLRDMDGVRALIECCDPDPIPSIIIAKRADHDAVEKALRDHVMAYLVEPVSRLDLKASIYLVTERFKEFRKLREENAELKEALEARKWVERAKGALMKQRDLDEPEAFRTLQKLASRKRTKLVEVARIIVEAEGLLGDDVLEMLPNGDRLSNNHVLGDHNGSASG